MGKILGFLLIVIGLLAGLVIGKLVSIPLHAEVLAGLLVAVIAGTLAINLVLQLRKRTTTNPQVCPKCGKTTHRVHRTRFDRLLSIFVSNLRRYACSNPTCRWSGALIVKEEYFDTHVHSHISTHSNSEENTNQ